MNPWFLASSGDRLDGLLLPAARKDILNRDPNMELVPDRKAIAYLRGYY